MFILEPPRVPFAFTDFPRSLTECLIMPSGSNKKSPAGGGGGGKGNKQHQQQQKKGNDKAAATTTATAAASAGDEDINSGFGQYMRSPQAIEMMKLFVVANTLVMFFTMAWPQMKHSYEIIRSMIYGDEEDEL